MDRILGNKREGDRKGVRSVFGIRFENAMLLRIVIPGGEGGFGDEGRFKKESGLEGGVCDGLREAGP